MAAFTLQADIGSARVIAKRKRRHFGTYSKMKELMALAAGLPTIFQDRADVAAGGLASYRLFQRETALEMRQIFTAGRTTNW